MNSQSIAPQLQQFVDGVSNVLDQNKPESEFHPEIGELVRELVKEDNWLDPKYAVPHPNITNSSRCISIRRRDSQ